MKLRALIFACVLVQAGFCQYSSMGTGAGTGVHTLTGNDGGVHTLGGWPFTSIVKLPRVWVNGLEYQGTTANTANFPAVWTCAVATTQATLAGPTDKRHRRKRRETREERERRESRERERRRETKEQRECRECRERERRRQGVPAPLAATNYGPYTTGNAGQNMAALQQQVNDAETCRTVNGTGTMIRIPPGMVFSNNVGLALPQTPGDTSTNFIVLQSTNPLPAGRTACSHGIQDNLPQSVRPGIRNLGCNATNLSYQLGQTVTQVPPGALTLANGTQTDTSAYNDLASMYTLESTQTNGNAIWTCNATSTTTCPNNADPNGVGPHHFAVLNAEVRMGANLYQVSSPIKIGQGGETALSQIPAHIHLAYLYTHGDWTDAPVTGTGANAVATSSPQGANQYPNNIIFQGCIYCSIAWTYNDKSTRPGAEGHVIAFNLAQQIKIVHNWFEGHSVNHMCGGWGGPISLNPWNNGVINPSQIFVACEDMEDRGNRYTYPYSWLLAAAAPGPVGPFRPASSMTTTAQTGSGAGLVLNLNGGRNGAVYSAALQAGGSGYNAGDVVTAQQTGLGQNAHFLVTGVSAGVVTGAVVASGTGYSVTSSPVNTTGGGGTGMTVNITSVGPGGQITGATMANPGSGYTNASLITVVQPGGSGGRVQPTAVSGVPTSIGVFAGGSGYNPANGLATTGGGGSLMTVNVTSVDTGGAITGVTLANPGSGYTTNSVITVVQSGATGGTVQPLTVQSGVPSNINVIDGTGYQINSFARKNSHEYKFSDRVLLDGNIFENVDYTGAQGTTVSFKMNQTSASNLGTNYWTVQTNSTMSNSIVRNGCNGTSMGFRSNWSAGGGVGQRADYYTYTNNLAYSIWMGNPGCAGTPGPYQLRVASATNGTTWGQSQSSPTIIAATYPSDVVTVSRDSAGVATLVLGGWGQGYTAGGPTLTTTAQTGSGTGLTVNVLSVDSRGQITGLAIVNPGSGYVSGDGVNIASQPGTTIPASVAILQTTGAGSSGPAAGIAIGIPGKGISGFAPGDTIMVNCPDGSFNTYTAAIDPNTSRMYWPPPQSTPTRGVAVTSAQTFGTIVSYPSSGTANATATNCYVTNVQGDPSYLYASHNSHFMTLNSGAKPGDPASDNLGPAGTGNFCGMARGITFVDSIAQGGGATASSLGEGTRTTVCSFDGGQSGSVLTYSHVTHPGRDTAVACPGHGAGSPGGIATCYTEYNNGVSPPSPQTIWGTLTPNCVGADPRLPPAAGGLGAEDCQGVFGNMSTGSNGFNYSLANWHDYRLCHAGDSACSGFASPYAAGGPRQASDGTDLGVFMPAIDNAQTLTQFPAAGSYADF